MPKKSKEKIQSEFFKWCLFRRDGVYYADGRGGSHDLGKNSLGTRDRQQALENLRRLDRQKATELNLIPREVACGKNDISIEEGWALFMDDRGRPNLLGGVGAASLKRYRAVRDKHIRFCTQTVQEMWGQIDRAAVLQYATWLHKKDYAPASVILEANTVASVVKFLVEKKQLPQGSRFEMGLPKIEESDRYCYRREEVAAMVELCQSHSSLVWLGNVIISLAVTGLRIDELAKMRRRDIDLEANTLRLTDERASRHRQQVGGARLLKGKHSRSLPLNAEFRKVLETLPARADGLVFHGPQGGRLKPDTVRNALVREVITPLKDKFPTAPGEIGFEHGRLHSFRHYFVSEAFRRGATEPWIMQWVGHRESRIVARYRHLRDDDAQLQMARLDLIGIQRGPDGPGSA